jgi:hypothetical protein
VAQAQRDHGTACVSCHTALPQVLARPSLRAQTGQSRRSAAEMAMFDDVTKRVYLWKEVEPFYPTSAWDPQIQRIARGGRRAQRADPGHARRRARPAGRRHQQAFANMWAQQMAMGDLKGGFPWLNFRLEPWESPAATYWGATLAALAVARAPGYARSRPDGGLRAYLRGGWPRNRSTPPR